MQVLIKNKESKELRLTQMRLGKSSGLYSIRYIPWAYQVLFESLRLMRVWPHQARSENETADLSQLISVSVRVHRKCSACFAIRVATYGRKPEQTSKSRDGAYIEATSLASEQA